MTTCFDDPDARIPDGEALREHIGPVHPLATGKVLNRLDQFCRDFIALSPFLVLASCDSEGNADASPRGDAPGFVRVLDDRTLLIPDRRGNNRVDSFGNILSSPGVGLVYSPRTPGIASLCEDNLRPSPDVGQDSVEVLLQAGFDRGAIDDLVKAGAVRVANGGGA